MSEEAPHFDALLGGTETLPGSLTLHAFMAHRTVEVNHMRQSISAGPTGCRLAFQTLPKHMRRRTMSHNVKRLPRRLRQIHLNQMRKSGAPARATRPARKHRRRPNNLAVERARRAARGPRWLETHVWHAKRFRMAARWGCQLACRPRDKCFRANYRAFSRHCLLEDVSYWACVEVEGGRDEIVRRMAGLQGAGLGISGLSMGAKAYLNTPREGTVLLYDTDNNPIGYVTFHWWSSDAINRLWIWSHPAYYTQVVDSLKSVFSNDTTIQITELKSELSRLRLTGPLSDAILHDTLKTVNFELFSDKVPWSCDETLKTITNRQSEMWSKLKNLSSCSVLTPGLIFGLIVQDPRFNLPKKRTKIVADEVNERSADVSRFESDLSRFVLCDKAIRTRVNEERLTNSKFMELRTKLLVPGSEFTVGLSFLPILLIQRPGNRTINPGLGSGWDVILPSNWTKSFWISFIMRGARVGGLRESNTNRFEMGRTFPLEPDTQAGRAWEQAAETARHARFFRLPPNKRPNYAKLRIAHPFRAPWPRLLADWGAAGAAVRVLRDRALLQRVARFLAGEAASVGADAGLLVGVRLALEARGAPAALALVCAPAAGEARAPAERRAPDANAARRRALRALHARMLRRVRKRRRRGRGAAAGDRLALAAYAGEMRRLWLPESPDVRRSCAREVIGFVQTGAFSLSRARGCAVGYIAAGCLAELARLGVRNRVLVRNTNSRLYKWAKLEVIVD